MYRSIKGVGDGSSPVVDITFPYLDKAHIQATIDGAAAEIIWLDASRIQFLAEVPVGHSWVVSRNSSIDARLVDYSDGSVLTEADLDKDSTQHQYLEQELNDLALGIQEQVEAEQVDRIAAVDALQARAVRAPTGETLVELPPAASRLGKLLGFDTTGDISVTALAIPYTQSQARIADSRIVLGNYTGMADGEAAILGEDKREGVFVWDSANHSADVTADPRQGVYVAPASDPTGASGAWVRMVKTVTPFHFGAQGDLITDDRDAFQAFNDWFLSRNQGRYRADATGRFGIAGTLNLGAPVASTDQQRYIIEGNTYIQQLTAGTFETVIFRKDGLNYSLWDGSLTVLGHEGLQATWANRTNGIGVTIAGLSVVRFTGHLRAYGFWYHGIYFPSDVGNTGNNDNSSFGSVDALYCGSGHVLAGYSQTANWSAPVRSGASRTTSQRDTLTVDALPPAAIETYFAVGNQPIFVKVGTSWHYVTGWDRVNNTITVYPWLYAADLAAGSGTLRYAYGGGVGLSGADSQIIAFDSVHVMLCGIGYADSALYGQRWNSLHSSNNGIGLTIGSGPANAHIGTSLDGAYFESNDTEIIQVATGNNVYNNHIDTAYVIDLSKVFVLGPLDTATDRRIASTGQTNGAGNVPVNYLTLSENGYRHEFYDAPIWNSLSSFSTLTFDDHRTPRRTFVQTANSQTVNLTVVPSQYNRLFGYRGARWTYVGTGKNGAPTGTFTFNPPAGGTVNGGAVGVGVTFSGFTGPAEFEIVFTTEDQLTWVVRPVSGWHLNGSATVDPASLASGSSALVAVITVPGAAIGDAFVPAFGTDLLGLVATAYVSAADTVKVVLANLTGAAVDIPSSTVKVSKVA